MDGVAPLAGHAPASVDRGPRINVDAAFERVRLDATSWVDVARGWLDGANDLYTTLIDTVEWRQGSVWRYERRIDEPRLTSWVGRGKAVPAPVLDDAYRDLRRRYGVEFDGHGLSRYRNGADSVAFHRDREMRYLDNTVIGILSLGATRPFLLKPRAVRPGARMRDDDSGARDFAPASGDLLVLGGRCQADWLHAVPKVRRAGAGRVSVQWRWTSRTGRPEIGPGYGAPRNFSR